MTAVKSADAGDAIGLEHAERGREGFDPAEMGAVGADARDDLRTIVEEEGDIAALHRARNRFRAVDQGALVGVLQAQQHGGDVGRVKHCADGVGEGGSVAERWCDEIKPLVPCSLPPCGGGMGRGVPRLYHPTPTLTPRHKGEGNALRVAQVHAALRSRSAFH